MGTLTFRRMAITDLDTVLAIERTVFSSPWTEGMFSTELRDGSFSFSWVMTLGQQIVGYLIYWVVVDELHLMNLAVAPPWQRQGIGMAGVQWIQQQGRENEMRRIFLEVRASNLPAQALYRKFGFYEAAARKNYYTAPREDALLFQYDFFSAER